MIQAKLTIINRAEVLRYLGYSGQILDSDSEEMVSRCINEAYSICMPRLTYRIFDLNDGKCPYIDLPGEDIRKLLSGCSRIVLFAATAGSSISELAYNRSITNPAEGAILNSCGSAAVENICDNFESELRKLTEADGYYLTDRFSPGYGDLPLTVQIQLCQLLDINRKIGVTLTDSCLMIPEKSVTAIMGISSEPVIRRERNCSICSLYETCSYRNTGRTCNDVTCHSEP